MEITAAIPAYNSLSYLKNLLPSLKDQGFDRVFILDDASIDGTAEWGNNQGINVIKGESNVGPTANRNRVRPYVNSGIILFLDADTEFISSGTASKIKEAFNTYPNLAVMSALIYTTENKPMWWNWGYESAPRQDGLAEALNKVASKHADNEEVMQTIREIAVGRVGHFEAIEDRSVDWVVEQFFAVRADVFHQLDGFDENFRMFHEGPDFCKRAKQAGYEVRFFKDIQLRHLDSRTGTSEDRKAQFRKSTIYWYQKHYNVPLNLIERFFLED